VGSIHLLLQVSRRLIRPTTILNREATTMTEHALLIGNRGEIAIRIARESAELGIPTVAMHPADDARSSVPCPPLRQRRRGAAGGTAEKMNVPLSRIDVDTGFRYTW
jgi:hypothetical protein